MDVDLLISEDTSMEQFSDDVVTTLNETNDNLHLLPTGQELTHTSVNLQATDPNELFVQQHETTEEFPTQDISLTDPLILLIDRHAMQQSQVYQFDEEITHYSPDILPFTLFPGECGFCPLIIIFGILLFILIMCLLHFPSVFLSFKEGKFI